MWRIIVKFFDKLEDVVRMSLSRFPILYTFIGGVAVVLFWRGVWITADLFPFLDGPTSIIVSVLILLITGLFVSFFIGDRIILSGLRGEKKLAEKTEAEIETDTEMLLEIKRQVEEIDGDIEAIEKDVENLKKSHHLKS